MIKLLTCICSSIYAFQGLLLAAPEQTPVTFCAPNLHAREGILPQAAHSPVQHSPWERFFLISRIGRRGRNFAASFF